MSKTGEVRGKLLHKILPLLLALSVVPLLLAGYQVLRVSRAYVEEEEIGRVQVGIAQRVSGNVSAYVENARNILQVIHKSGDFLTMDPRRQTVILENVMNAYPMFMQLSVLNLQGKEMARVNRLGGTDAVPQKEILQHAQADGEYISPVTRSAERYPLLTIAVPVERIPGRPIGVLIGVINLIDLSSLVENLRVGKTGYIFVVDADWNLIAHPERSAVYSENSPSELEAMKSEKIQQEIGERSFGAITFEDQKNQKFIDAFATVPKLNWRVFVQQPIEEAFESSSRMRGAITRTLIGVALLTICLAFFFSQSLVRRVKILQSAMEQVGVGNFDVPDVPFSNDEFGSLSEKFVWMARSLKDKTLRLILAQRELQKWNSELERRVEERTRALQEAQEQLIAQEKLAALGQMASVVGHELRNPLAVMNNSVYFLKSKLTTAAAGALDPKLEKHLQIIEGEIAKSNTIIRDILDFARNRALSAASHKMDEMVEKAIERIQIPTGVSLVKQLTLADLEVVFDEDEIRQVLVNLMENACQAMTSGGTLKVSTQTQGDKVQIDITDTGCGIPQEHIAKIFAPFFTTKSRGTGLGLAVVKKVIDRHMGQLEVESRVGEGTTFHIRLPIKGPQGVTVGSGSTVIGATEAGTTRFVSNG